MNECRECEDCESRLDGVFSALPTPLIHKLSQAKVTNKYLPNQFIFYQDNVPTGLYCIASGKIKLTTLTVSGKEQLLNVYHGGNIIGYRALFASERYFATAQAIEESVVCFVDKNTIFDLIRESPTLAMSLIAKFCKEMGTANARVTSTSYKSVDERLAEHLLCLNETYGKKIENGKWEITIHLKREELAQLVGTSVETVIRLLSQMEDQRLIARKGKIIQILQKEKLVTLAKLPD